MSAITKLDLAGLYAHATAVFRQGGGTRPQVSLIELGSERAVLKDYSRSDPWFRFVIGPLITYREVRALRALRDIPGIPRLLRQVNRRAFLMEYIEGVTPREQDQARPFASPEMFERLYELVQAMHARGVAHCDLRSGGNTIIDKQGQPYVVDFVSNFVRGSAWNLAWRWAFDRFCEADIVAVARLKKRLVPDMLTPAERQNLQREQQSRLAYWARRTGQSIRNISRFFLTRR
ncbi:MAG: hypothetical protein OEY67_08275 [Gammaproteobacteria bacterium]|nr:hypothetical protein [Gammaproteobacteria bacterium]